MRAKAIVPGAVVIAILLLISIPFITARQSSAAISVRYVKSVPSGELVPARFANRAVWLGGVNVAPSRPGKVTAIFEITNQTTSRRYSVEPVSFEVRHGLVWRKCFDFNPSPLPLLGPHGSATAAFNMTNLPTGSPLRLEMRVYEELPGLLGVCMRLKLRFLHHTKIPLNPFDKNSAVFSEPTQLVSDEFVELEPKATSKAKSAK